MMTLAELVRASLKEDIGESDWTTRCLVPAHAQGTAKVIAKAEGIVSGLEPFREVFRQLDASVIVKALISDGQAVTVGDQTVHLDGSLAAILTGERTALNFLQRLSGIATLTHQFVQEVKDTKTVILDTRKTTPLLRILEKAAVCHGGGRNHRIGLYDMILIKENHLSSVAGEIKAAVQRTKNTLQAAGKHLPLEIEVKNLQELSEALTLEVDRILLDNFTVELIREAVRLTAHRIPLEVSGGINLNNVRAVALTGIDYISIGALTHSAPALDFSLLIEA